MIAEVLEVGTRFSNALIFSEFKVSHATKARKLVGSTSSTHHQERLVQAGIELSDQGPHVPPLQVS